MYAENRHISTVFHNQQLLFTFVSNEMTFLLTSEKIQARLNNFSAIKKFTLAKEVASQRIIKMTELDSFSVNKSFHIMEVTQNLQLNMPTKH